MRNIQVSRRLTLTTHDRRLHRLPEEARTGAYSHATANVDRSERVWGRRSYLHYACRPFFHGSGLFQTWYLGKCRFPFAIHHLNERVSVSGGTSFFHLAIRCDSRMVSLIEHMRTLDNIEFTPTTSAWHSLLNADGAPCLHIAANLHKPAIIEGLLLQKPETLNESFGSRAYTLMHVIADSGR